MLSARHAGTEVLITIADDGCGLNRERIRPSAIERGLIPADAAVTDNELFQILFLPGFSTAAQVTSMSGRGVGMDVVKRTIEGLRGKIDLASTAGSGTEIDVAAAADDGHYRRADGPGRERALRHAAGHG